VGLALALLGATGCGPRQHPTAEIPEDAYPTELVPPALLAGDFAAEQEVTMTHPRGTNTFRSVLQKQGDRIVLLALGPHGGRAFAITQVGEEISYESWMPDSQQLPFPPRFILHDVQRTWFLPPQDTASETRAEVREDGQVVERRYARRDGQPEGEIVVTYEGGMDPEAPLRAAPPDVVRFDNGWYGYTATIRTLSWQPL